MIRQAIAALSQIQQHNHMELILLGRSKRKASTGKRNLDQAKRERREAKQRERASKAKTTGPEAN